MRQLPVEYGGDFHLSDKASCDTVVEDSSERVFLRCGRDALRLVRNQLNESCDTIIMPSLCCQSMEQPFLEAGWNVRHYAVDESLRIDIDSLALIAKKNPNSAFLYLNYYGKRSISQEHILGLKEDFNLTVIKDSTHDIQSMQKMSDPLVDDYEIASIRKWVPIPDGAFAFSKKKLDVSTVDSSDEQHESIKLAAMQRKAQYLRGEDIAKSSFLDDFAHCRILLETDLSIRSMGFESRKILGEVDWPTVMAKREENASHLTQLLLLEGIDMKFCDLRIPLYLPVVFPNQRDEMQKELAMRNVYCPVLWPLSKEASRCSGYGSYFAEHMLAVPCDQRYTKTDMDYIAHVIAEVCKTRLKQR